MPHGWTIIDGTPDPLKDLWNDPQAFKTTVVEMLPAADAAASVEEVYFHFRKDGRRAHVLTHHPDADGGTVLRLQETFETDKVSLLLDPAEKRDRLDAAS